MILVDSDGDGLPDLWEQQYFGGLQFGAHDDTDSDSMSNLAEYKAGTNPNDHDSRFAFIHVQTAPEGGVLVEWSSVEGESYSLHRSSDLLSGFTIIQANILAAGPVNSYRNATALGPGPHFYRVQLQE